MKGALWYGVAMEFACEASPFDFCLVLYLFAADLFPSIRSVLSCLLRVDLFFCLLLCLILCHVGLDLQLSTVGS